jgi:hypothetical protein
MLCDGCQQRQALLLITDIETGEVLAFCVACSGVWAETHAKALLDVLGADYPGQLGAWLSAPPSPVAAATGPDADGEPVKPKARRPRKPKGGEPDGYDPNRTVAEIVESAPTPPDEPVEGVSTDGVLQ